MFSPPCLIFYLSSTFFYNATKNLWGWKFPDLITVLLHSWVTGTELSIFLRQDLVLICQWLQSSFWKPNGIWHCGNPETKRTSFLDCQNTNGHHCTTKTLSAE